MRTLPQAPNLDYVKQQAKDLLAALRETRPESSLADAQKTLAKQYGFQSWSELRAEIERVRANREPFDASIGAGIAESFELGDLKEQPSLISDDVMGPSIRLLTQRGEWSAHAVLEWVDEIQAAEAVRLMNAAGEAGVKTPEAIRSMAGNLVEAIGDARWRVDSWINLGPTIAIPVPSNLARKAGELLATLHELHLEPVRGMNPWLSASRRTEEHWRKIIAFAVEANAPWVHKLEDAIPAILDISSVAMDPPSEPFVLSMTNLQPGSVHLGEHGSLTPIGWEYAGAIPPGWEIGLSLMSWCAAPDERINTAAARPFVEGYAAIRGSTPQLDISVFSPAITAWLNWLVSRISASVQSEGEPKAQATRELMSMLEFPKTRPSLETLLDAANG